MAASLDVTVKVARSALRLPLALWERAGVRETVMAAATYVLSGGAGAMTVRPDLRPSRDRDARKARQADRQAGGAGCQGVADAQREAVRTGLQVQADLVPG
jgi:hypothetical protein